MDKQRIAKELLMVAKELIAGTWSLPTFPSHVNKISQIYNNMKSGEEPDNVWTDPKQALYPYLGDDQLFDAFEIAQKKYYKECAKALKNTVDKMVKLKEDDFRELEEYQMIQALAKKM